MDPVVKPEDDPGRGGQSLVSCHAGMIIRARVSKLSPCLVTPEGAKRRSGTPLGSSFISKFTATGFQPSQGRQRVFRGAFWGSLGTLEKGRWNSNLVVFVVQQPCVHLAVVGIRHVLMHQSTVGEETLRDTLDQFVIAGT